MGGRLRYAVIGTGLMGCEHIRNLGELDGSEVVAFADPNEQPRAWARKALGGNSAAEYSDYRRMLDEVDCDVIVIASPNFTHAQVLDAVFDSGRHIMVEKPLCTSVKDAKAVAIRAERILPW